MKKFINYLFVIFFLLFIGGFVSNGLPSLIKNDLNEIEFTDSINTSNDEMLLEEGQFMLTLNQTAVQSYFSSNAYSSRNELEELYSEFYEVYTSQYDEMTNDKMKIYICLENELGQMMYVYGNAWFNESAEMVRMNISWYDNTEIVDFMRTGSIVLGTTLKYFVGTKLKVNSKSILAMEGIFDGELQYFDLSNLNNRIKRLCDSLFSDLFTIKTSSMSNLGTENNGNGVQNIDVAFLNMIYEGYPVWDIDSFGTDIPYESIFNKLYSSDLEDEGAQEIQNALILKYVYTNDLNLNTKTFYLVIDSLLDYVGLSIYENNEYDLIWYRDDTTSYVSDTLFYDLTNYYCSEESTLLGKSIVYSSDDNQMFHTIPLSKVISGVSEETDFPIYLNKFIGYDEINNYIYVNKNLNQKYYLYDVMTNRTLDFTSEEIGEIYYELDDLGEPIPLGSDGDTDLPTSITFEEGKIYVINACQYYNNSFGDFECGYAFYHLYQTSISSLTSKCYYVDEMGTDWCEDYLGDRYEPINDLETEIGNDYKSILKDKIGCPLVSDNNYYWCSNGSNIIIIPSKDITLNLDLSKIIDYSAYRFEIASAKLY